MTPIILAAVSTGTAILVAVAIIALIVWLSREGETRDSHWNKPRRSLKPDNYKPSDDANCGDDS